MDMLLDDIKPYVRYAKILHMPGDYRSTDMRAYDNRILYFLSENASLTLDGAVYRPGRGALFLWSPDTVYSLSSLSPEGFDVMVVNFDYRFDARKISLCLPPVVSDAYDPGRRIETVRFSDAPILEKPVCLPDMHMLEYDMHCLDKEFVSPQRNYAAMLSAVLAKIILSVYRQAISAGSGGISALVQNVIAYIHENPAGDLSNAAIGQHFSYHPNYLNRCMLLSTGQTLHQYVINTRVLKALELLQTTDLSVTDIAAAVGFCSIKHFSQSFKKAYGCSPTHFR
ncbi:MAG: helix-turn-helix transcriptional regulator [Clostridia bacterium]|nr:helix-turn-helix transcriptional regulator [Clostridia bacterium]